VVALAFACAAWAPAQEDAPKPKRSPAQVAQDAKAKAAREKKAKERAKAEAEARAKAIDINHATKDQLRLIPGVTEAYAAAIIAKRPYKVKADLVLKHAIPFGLYQSLRKRVKLAAD
jgi:DNA uptake protein ComE-like DNA-binding protein